MTTTILDSFRDWLAGVDSHRTNTAARLERSKGPCPGGTDDRCLICDDCSSDAEPSNHSSPGDPCPEATGEEQCRGHLQYRYDPASTEHDWDGGSCWRCSALDPGYFDGDGPMAAVNSAEPEASIPESMVRILMEALEEGQETARLAKARGWIPDPEAACPRGAGTFLDAGTTAGLARVDELVALIDHLALGHREWVEYHASRATQGWDGDVDLFHSRVKALIDAVLTPDRPQRRLVVPEGPGPTFVSDSGRIVKDPRK